MWEGKTPPTPPPPPPRLGRFAPSPRTSDKMCPLRGFAPPKLKVFRRAWYLGVSVKLLPKICHIFFLFYLHFNSFHHQHFKLVKWKYLYHILIVHILTKHGNTQHSSLFVQHKLNFWKSKHIIGRVGTQIISGVMSQNIWGAQSLRGSEATKPEGA